MTPEIEDSAEVVIIGAGAAGLFSALTLAPKRVIVLSKEPLGGICASAWAQGGIAAAVGEKDTIISHVSDTIKAAAGTADTEVVDVLINEAPRYVKILEKYGVRFDRDNTGTFRLSREACHTCRRVLRAAAGDGFGHELMRALTEAVKKTPSILFKEGITAEKIIRSNGTDKGSVQGVLVRQTKENKPMIFTAPAVILATGGIGNLYTVTTNPPSAIGRGIAMAARAGAQLSDLEFVQFHPTALDTNENPAPLATESLRGEGAHLLNGLGEKFMPKYHKMAEMAPRDVVSRAIFAQLQKSQKVFLDCRHIDVTHFPAFLKTCARAGLDPEHDLVPVVLAAHYHMGGVATDLKGRTSVPGLWACGEVAATGLHGANRIASNSLMEVIVMGGRAAADIQNTGKPTPKKVKINIKALPTLPQTCVPQPEENTLRHIMTDMAGIVRHKQDMIKALRHIISIEQKAEGVNSRLADKALVSRMIVISALHRTESRGGHYRADYPKPVKSWRKRSFVTLKEINTLTYCALTPNAKKGNFA
ncbi:MAG: L-aspartate oxidase [Alphaproteobacteria bacterium]|nr:L-aspartate oxidase [Alphaproteobacteria bacterium]